MLLSGASPVESALYAHRATLAVGGEHTLKSRAQRLVEAVRDALDADDIRMVLLDETTDLGEIVAVWPRARVVDAMFPAEDGPFGLVARAGGPVRIADVLADTRSGWSDPTVAEGARSWLGAPLVEAAGVFGALIVASRRPNVFGPGDEATIAAMAEAASPLLGDVRRLHIAACMLDELEASETRQRDLAASAADWFWELDTNLRFRWVPTRHAGPAPLLPVEPTASGCEPPGLPEEDRQRFQAAVRTRRPFRHLRLLQVMADGSVRTMSFNGKPTFDRSGAFRGYLGSAVDLSGVLEPDALANELYKTRSEQARDEAMLRHRARQLAALADLIEMTRTTVHLSRLLEQIAISTLALFNADFVQVLRALPGEESYRLDAGAGWCPGEVGVLTVDGGPGSQVWFALDADEPIAIADLRAERRFEPMAMLRERGVVGGAMARIGSGPQPAGVLGVYAQRPMAISDTDRHLLRAVASVMAIAIERQHLRHLSTTFADDNPDPIAHLDAELRCVYANAALLGAIGRKRATVLGAALTEVGLASPDQLESLELVAQSALRSGREREMETLAPTPRGERALRLRFVPERSHGDTVESMLVIGRDVSDERRLRDECRALRRELTERAQREQELYRELAAEQQRNREHDRRSVDATMIAGQLTPREIEILQLLTSGLTNKQIAVRLDLSPGTVRNHLGRLFPKLDAADRTRAAVRAIELGLVEDHDGDDAAERPSLMTSGRG